VMTEVKEIFVMINPAAKVMGSLLPCVYVQIKGNIDFA